MSARKPLAKPDFRSTLEKNVERAAALASKINAYVECYAARGNGVDATTTETLAQQPIRYDKLDRSLACELCECRSTASADRKRVAALFERWRPTPNGEFEYHVDGYAGNEIELPPLALFYVTPPTLTAHGAVQLALRRWPKDDDPSASDIEQFEHALDVFASTLVAHPDFELFEEIVAPLDFDCTDDEDDEP